MDLVNMNMYGQWVGNYQGSNKGKIILDIDDRGDYLSGTCYLFDDNNFPGSLVRFKTQNCHHTHLLEGLPIYALDPVTGNINKPEMIFMKHPEWKDAYYPKKASVKMSLDEEQLEINWTTDIGTFGSSFIKRNQAHANSAINPNETICSWDDFRKEVCSLKRGRFIFRGQPSTWRLRTAFHRTNRKDVFSFMEEDIPRLHQRLSGLTESPRV